MLRGIGEIGVATRVKAFQQPEQMHVLPDRWIGFVRGGATADGVQRRAERGHGVRAEAILDLAHRQQPSGEARRAQFIDQAGETLGQGRVAQCRLPVLAAIDHAPDAPAFAVASRMGQRHLVVTDDPVVKVGDVQRAVRSELIVHRPEPRIGGGEEIRLLDGLRGRAVEDQMVAIQPARHDIPDEEIVLIFRRPEVVVVVQRPVDGGAAVGVLHQDRCKAEAVMRLAEARIVAALQQLVDRRAVAVAGIEVAARVPRKAERIHLTVGVLLDVGAVEADAVGVAGIEIDVTAVARRDVRVVVEAVRGVEPAVESAPER